MENKSKREISNKNISDTIKTLIMMVKLCVSMFYTRAVKQKSY